MNNEPLGPMPPMRDGVPISWPLYADWQRRRAERAEDLLREASIVIHVYERELGLESSGSIQNGINAHFKEVAP